MNPLYIDLHIHTSDNPNQIHENYDLELLNRKIREFNGDSEYLISLTDHNVLNKKAYLIAVELGLNIIPGVELHIKNYDGCSAYHCHMYFDLPIITDDVIDDINKRLMRIKS